MTNPTIDKHGKLGDLKTLMEAMACYICSSEEFLDWIMLANESWVDTSRLEDEERSDIEMAERFLKHKEFL